MTGGPKKSVTSREIAAAAGVTQPTVSRALRGDPRVAPETTKLIEEVARRLGYVPHAAARTLATRESGNIALVVAELDNPFYPELLEALRAEFDTLGLRIVLLSERTRDVGQSLEALIRSHSVDGAIVATATIDEETTDFLRSSFGPVVLMVRDVPGSGRDVVVADNAGGGELAARHLLELGHRRIASILGPADTWTARERGAGFARGLGGSDVRRTERSGSYTHESGFRIGLQLMREDPPPTAIFCGNDAIALGVLDAARAAGLGVPADVSVIGFDDIEAASWESFRLTTIRQPLEEMARAAAGALWAAMREKAPGERQIVLPTSLVVRSTTAVVTP